ncbi:uncharacterized protein G2W53_041902 [Senna tora]|uniref:Uncharacterized protein n=1 Tax=Senna tora TaxID=362788 RepID=A0A834W1V7_9FABA|nr:uncharacterized protein G2W53_041902 [Senna tora]
MEKQHQREGNLANQISHSLTNGRAVQAEEEKKPLNIGENRKRRAVVPAREEERKRGVCFVSMQLGYEQRGKRNKFF